MADEPDYRPGSEAALSSLESFDNARVIAADAAWAAWVVERSNEKQAATRGISGKWGYVKKAAALNTIRYHEPKES